MNIRHVTVIPATKTKTTLHSGTPGKLRVVGYAQVIKGTGAGVQIRKNIRKVIADRTDWEIAFVTTDLKRTLYQDSTSKSYLQIIRGIRNKFFDILIIHSADDLGKAYSIAEWLIPLCKECGVEGYILHDDVLISEFDFMQ